MQGGNLLRHAADGIADGEATSGRNESVFRAQVGKCFLVLLGLLFYFLTFRWLRQRQRSTRNREYYLQVLDLSKEN